MWRQKGCSSGSQNSLFDAQCTLSLDLTGKKSIFSISGNEMAQCHLTFQSVLSKRIKCSNVNIVDHFFVLRLIVFKTLEIDQRAAISFIGAMNGR